MATALDIALFAAGMVAIAGGAFLALRGILHASTGFLVGVLVTFGVLQTLSLVASFGHDIEALYRAIYLLSVPLTVGFVVAYPALVLRPMQKWLIAWSALPALALAGDALLRGVPDRQTGNVLALAGEFYLFAFHVIAPLVFFRRWGVAREPEVRRQLLWGFAPFLFWSAHDALWLARFAPYLRLPTSLPEAFYQAGLALALVTVAAVALVGLRALVAWRRAGAREERALALIIGASFAISVIQLFDPGLHVLIDSVAVLLLFYAVARYRIVDVDLKLRWTLRQSTVAGIFLAVFFVASESAAVFLGDTIGSTYAGIAVTALLVFALAPVQRLAERVSARAVPVRGGTDTYLAFRRLEIYRAALAGALTDGVDVQEAHALRALRSELGISEADHESLLRDLRERALPGAAAAPA
ncbi:MAG TPA: hypothetical protein VM582_04710 [Candidatus Thermoplasmatota archaeon]|nr:hypothetical protein [Candidatus Thermoplasmatota archaeon]